MDAGPTPRTYALTTAALFLLLLVAVGIPFLAPDGLDLVLGLAVALAKAVLIGLYFMHVRYETPIVAVFATAGLLWLTILFWLTLNDYLTRA